MIDQNIEQDVSDCLASFSVYLRSREFMKILSLDDAAKEEIIVGEVLSESVIHLLTFLHQGKITPPAFFHTIKSWASSCDSVCIELTFKGIVADEKFSESEKKLLMELMCGNKWQRGDKMYGIWKNKSNQ